MPLSDDAIREKVIRHDYEFKALSENLNNVVKELHELTSALKHVGVIAEKLENMDINLKESFQRIHKRTDDIEKEVRFLKESRGEKGCNALEKAMGSVDVLNRAVYGKDGRGGLVFDVEDLKKFMYKSMSYFALFNLVIAAIVGWIFK